MKPYDLVIVQNSFGQHCGQIISKPFLNKVMVRLVPDDPSTMVELWTNLLTISSVKYRYVQYAKVSGMFSFPEDMLRYDFAAPANFSLVNGEVKLNHNETDLIIGRAVCLKRKNWAVDRWKSFGWNITPLKTLKLIGETK